MPPSSDTAAPLVELKAQPLTLGLISRVLGVGDPARIVGLRSLQLDSAGISSVRDLEAFAGTLRELQLRSNLLTLLDSDSLAAVASSLVVLVLSRNRLQSIEDAGLGSFARLRVLDLSHNNLTETPSVEALPETLTVYDLRGNGCEAQSETPEYRATVSSRCGALEELNGSPFEHPPRENSSEGGSSSLRASDVDSLAAFGSTRRHVVAQRTERVVYVPLLGSEEGEVPRRTIALRFSVGDDLFAVATEFCSRHQVEGAAAVDAIVDIMQTAVHRPPMMHSVAPEEAAVVARVGLDSEETKGQTELEVQVERTYNKLRAFSEDLEANVEDSRGRTRQSFAAKREAIRRRAEDRRKMTSVRTKEVAAESAKLRADLDGDLRQRRREFASGVRDRLADDTETPRVLTEEEEDDTPPAPEPRDIYHAADPDELSHLEEIERPIYGDSSDEETLP